MRGNFGLFCSFSPKLLRIHVGLHSNANEKINRNKALLDDFLIVEPASPYARLDQACQVSLFSPLLAFRNLGIPVASNKTQVPDKV